MARPRCECRIARCRRWRWSRAFTSTSQALQEPASTSRMESERPSTFFILLSNCRPRTSISVTAFFGQSGTPPSGSQLSLAASSNFFDIPDRLFRTMPGAFPAEDAFAHVDGDRAVAFIYRPGRADLHTGLVHPAQVYVDLGHPHMPVIWFDTACQGSRSSPPPSS